MTDTLVVVQAMVMLLLAVLLAFWMLRLEIRWLGRRVEKLESTTREVCNG